jgi:hypothetical protein
MGLYIIWDFTHIIGDGPDGGPLTTGNLKMENQNFIPAETLDPRDARIVELERELEAARTASRLQRDQLDQVGDVIMGVIGDKVEALIESYVDNVKDDVMDEFSIYDYQSEIDEMISDRLPDDDDDIGRDDVKSIIKEVLAGSTLTLDIE